MKMAIRCWAVLASISLLTTACDQAPKSTTPNTITVNGTSSVRVPTDRVVFSVGVESQARDAREAFAMNTSKVEAVVAALRGKGVQAKEIQTSNLDISSRDERGEKLDGYRVSSIVTVTREDPNGVADLLQTAVSAGANQAGGLRFSVGDPAKLRSRGLELAFEDARAKASVLASQAKRSLGPVVSVSEGAPWNVAGMANNLAALGYVGAGGIQSGSQEVQFAISVVFELK